MNNAQKFEVMLEVAYSLNQELGSVPILYGSLGLSRAINKDIKTDDIDILVEDIIFHEKLELIHEIMQGLNFILTVPEENEFRRGEIKIGIASDGDLHSFSGVDPTELKVESARSQFRVLSPLQYLSTYKSSCLDGYRKNTHKKDDYAKVKLIELFINQ